jgi:predicted DNA-binding antitoxin AbrB/MazE fold protein
MLMTMTIRAVYEGGVLRPIEPLALPEGETVDIVIARKKPLDTLLRAPTPAEEDYARRISAAKSLGEMFAVMATAPALPEDEIEVAKAINESRRLTGFRMPDPELPEENPR